MRCASPQRQGPNRYYLRGGGLSFREQRPILFEIATDGRGFEADEAAEPLGGTFGPCRPSWAATRRHRARAESAVSFCITPRKAGEGGPPSKRRPGGAARRSARQPHPSPRSTALARSHPPPWRRDGGKRQTRSLSLPRHESLKALAGFRRFQAPTEFGGLLIDAPRRYRAHFH